MNTGIISSTSIQKTLLMVGKPLLMVGKPPLMVEASHHDGEDYADEYRVLC